QRDGGAGVVDESLPAPVGEGVDRALPGLARLCARGEVAELREPLRLDVVLALPGPVEDPAVPRHLQEVVRAGSAVADEAEDLVREEAELAVDQATGHSL